MLMYFPRIYSESLTQFPLREISTIDKWLRKKRNPRSYFQFGNPSHTFRAFHNIALSTKPPTPKGVIRIGRFAIPFELNTRTLDQGIPLNTIQVPPQLTCLHCPLPDHWYVRILSRHSRCCYGCSSFVRGLNLTVAPVRFLSRHSRLSFTIAARSSFGSSNDLSTPLVSWMDLS